MFEWLRNRRKGQPTQRSKEAESLFRHKYGNFRNLLESNSELLEIISEMQAKLRGETVFGYQFLSASASRVVFHSARLVDSLRQLSGGRYASLDRKQKELAREIRNLVRVSDVSEGRLTLEFPEIRSHMAPLVGGKNANLGEMAHLGLPTPRGFAVTTSAFAAVLAHEGLGDEIRSLLLGLHPEDNQDVVRVCEAIQALFLKTPLPDQVAEALFDGFDALAGHLDQPAGELRLAVRSSAVGEDSELSFAGQYLSMLNVDRKELARSYSMVLASLFTPRAVAYRLYKGVSFMHTPMAVACLAMVDSVASGVMYTADPLGGSQDSILINGLWGLGAYVVDGAREPDSFTVARNPEPRIVRLHVALKSSMLKAGPENRVEDRPVPDHLQRQPVLNKEQILALATWGIRLEEHHGCAQDVEWTVGQDEGLMLLQARPLGIAGPVEDVPVSPEGPEPLLEGGDTASPGRGSGPVCQVLNDEDMADFPAGAVLVAPSSSPRLALVLPKAAAVVAEAGSVTGHMASVAREFGIPALLNLKGALQVLARGMEVTVDASSRAVYPGFAGDAGVPPRVRTPMAGTPVMGVLRELAGLITPLHLTDPASREFRPEYCRTIHDIMRFAHEQSYAEMFRVNDLTSDLGGHAMKLEAPLPLDLYVLDLGGGISGGRGGRITPEQVASTPFKALLRGMMHEDLRFLEPRPVQLGGLFSVMARQMLEPPDTGGQRFGDRSYALVSDKYLNFSSRVGYHYSVLDGYCGLTRNNNYIHFEFKGGAADETRRSRRARSIARILEELEFQVEVKGDFVQARLPKRSPRVVEDRLDQLGRLLLYTRQMDMLMTGEASVEACALHFLAGRYDHC